MLEGSIATASGVYCDTFHGFCSSVLRKHVSLLKVDQRIDIADENVQLRVMTSILESKGYKTSTASSMNLLRQIRFWKERGLGYFGIRSEALQTWTEKRAYELYPDYQNSLRSMSALDFGDLLLFTLRLFREQPDVLDIYRNRFRHILVDEFQDISPAQYDILRILSVGAIGKYSLSQSSGGEPSDAPSKFSSSPVSNLDPKWLSTPPNSMKEFLVDGKPIFFGKDVTEKNKKLEVHVFCAGDDDQSIYAWRGSQIELMRRFRFDFPNSKILKFDVSYRMSSTLCKATAAIVDPLVGRIPKQLNAESTDASVYEEGAALEVRRLFNEAHELEWIVAYLSRIDSFPGKMDGRSTVAVVGRSQQDIRRISEALEAAGIQFNVETVDVGIQTSMVFNGPLSFLKLAMDPNNNAAFKYSLEDSIFFRGISQEKIEEFILNPVKEISDTKSLTYFEAARHCVLTKKIFPAYSKALEQFIRAYDTATVELQQKSQLDRSLQDIVKQVLFSVYGNEPIPAITKAIEELARNACIYTNFVHFMATFLQGESTPGQQWLFSEEPAGWSKPTNSIQQKVVSVMNMHAAKGLEFDEVILPFWIDGNVPRSDTPEERRLAFVSLTRARHKVMISFSKYTSRGINSNSEAKPSIYIDEFVNKRDGLHDTLFEDLSEDGRSCVDIIAEDIPKRRRKKSAKEVRQDFVLDEIPQVTPATSKELFGDSFEIKKTLRKSNVPNASITIPSKKRAQAKQEKSHILPCSPLKKANVKELLSGTSIKSGVVKRLFSDEIRRLFSCKRASIKVVENGVEVKKALSLCTVQQLGQYLLKFLET